MRNPYLILLLCLLIQGGLKAQGDATNQSLFQYFSSIKDSVPLIILETDARQLVKKKLSEEYQPTTFRFQNAAGEWVSLSGKVRARGNMRKQVCYFPPLKINLKKGDLQDLGFQRLDVLKLVLQCWENKRGYALLHREQLLYQLHEEVGPFSYRTALIRVQLGDDKDDVYYAFLIEEESEFAQRLNGPVVEKGRIRSKLIDREAYLRMCFFQYLILNTDWYMHNQHNLEFIRPDGYELFCPVPYDFDYAGLVNASYAVPHESRNIKDVRQPCYLCDDVSVEEAQEMASFFKEKKSRLYQIVKDYPHLKEKDKEDFIYRLDTFYKEIENDKLVDRFFANKKE